MHLVNPQVYFKCIAQSMLYWWLDHALQYYGAWALSQMLVEGGFIRICRLPWQDTNVAKTLTHPNPNSRIASQTDLQGFDWRRKLLWWACCCLMLFVVFLFLAWRGSIILLWCKLATICWLVNMQGSTRQGLRASSVLTKEDKHVLGKS